MQIDIEYLQFRVLVNFKEVIESAAAGSKNRKCYA